MRVDVAVNVTGQTDVLLPKYDPVASEENEEPHEPADSGEHQREEAGPDPPGHGEAGINPQADAKQEGEHQDGQNQPVVSHYYAEISRDCGDGRRRRISGLARFPEKE